jgi:hypothetical protein
MTIVERASVPGAEWKPEFRDWRPVRLDAGMVVLCDEGIAIAVAGGQGLGTDAVVGGQYYSWRLVPACDACDLGWVIGSCGIDCCGRWTCSCPAGEVARALGELPPLDRECAQ